MDYSTKDLSLFKTKNQRMAGTIEQKGEKIIFSDDHR